MDNKEDDRPSKRIVYGDGDGGFGLLEKEKGAGVYSVVFQSMYWDIA